MLVAKFARLSKAETKKIIQLMESRICPPLTQTFIFGAQRIY